MNQNIITTDKMSELGKKIFEFAKIEVLPFEYDDQKVFDAVKGFLILNPKITIDEINELPSFYDVKLYDKCNDGYFMFEVMLGCDSIRGYAKWILEGNTELPAPIKFEGGIDRPASPPMECYEYQGHAAMIDFNKMYGDDIRV